MNAFVQSNELFLRSTVRAEMSSGKEKSLECNLFSLNAWHKLTGHNFHGPITFKLPLSVLETRRFYVFERKMRSWTHRYLLQREVMTPLFRFKKAPSCKLSEVFEQGRKNCYSMADNVQYEIILTKPAPLTGAKIIPTHHRNCVPAICNGQTKAKSQRSLDTFVDARLEELARLFPHRRHQLRAAKKEVVGKW